MFINFIIEARAPFNIKINILIQSYYSKGNIFAIAFIFA